MQIPVSEDWERRQRRQLRRYRVFATGLLVLMAAIFVATRLVDEPGFWIRLVESGAEAAVVGGLADWFAVTALFRRPLGLPIPHTAVIPRNKDRIGDGLARFVESHFLEPGLVMARVRQLDLAGRLSAWLTRPGVPEAVSDRVLSALPAVLRTTRDSRLRALVQRALRAQLATVDLAPALGRLLSVLRDGDRHHVLFDSALVEMRRYLLANRETVLRIVAERSAWWVPSRVDRRVADAILEGAADLLDQLSVPGNESRVRLERAFDRLIDDLRSSPETARTVARFRDRLLDDPAVKRYLGAVWDEAKALLTDQAEQPGSVLRTGLADALRTVGRSLDRDPALRARLDAWVEEAVHRLAVPWRREIGAFIADVVRGWDAKTVSARIELSVGSDLQYIRMNGTLVGALVGCAIFLGLEATARL